MTTLRSQGVMPSPLLQCPGFSLDLVVLDWLHVMDLGVSQDCLGNLFNDVLSLAGAPGASRKHKLDWLWNEIQQYYSMVKPPSVLDHLTEEMFKQPSKKNKLKAKGGETRYLVPFAVCLAQQLAREPGGRHWEACSAFFQRLHGIMLAMAQDEYDAVGVGVLSREFCILYAGLEKSCAEQGRTHCWSAKPKLLMMQELLEYDAARLGNPRLFWCYKDESFCGYWAKASKRRGGAHTATATAERFLTRYRALSKPIEAAA